MKEGGNGSEWPLAAYSEDDSEKVLPAGDTKMAGLLSRILEQFGEMDSRFEKEVRKNI